MGGGGDRFPLCSGHKASGDRLVFRLRGLPFWVTVLEDLFSVGLVLFAFKAPKNGGLIAILLLWIVVRSSTAWRTWFLANHSRDQPSEPKNRQ